jgi:hypothetical protein
MLARYSSDFVICRELIQNGIRFRSRRVFRFSSLTPSGRVSSIFGLFLFCLADDAGAKHFVLELTVEPDIDAKSSSSAGAGAGGVRAPAIIEMRARNDGRLFTSEDWHRLATIAEGNPDESTVCVCMCVYVCVFSFARSCCRLSAALLTDTHVLTDRWACLVSVSIRYFH